MPDLKLNDFGRFVFKDRYGYKKDIEGAYVESIGPTKVVIRDLWEEGSVYNVAKKDISLFEPQKKK